MLVYIEKFIFGIMKNLTFPSLNPHNPPIYRGKVWRAESMNFTSKSLTFLSYNTHKRGIWGYFNYFRV